MPVRWLSSPLGPLPGSVWQSWRSATGTVSWAPGLGRGWALSGLTQGFEPLQSAGWLWHAPAGDGAWAPVPLRPRLQTRMLRPACLALALAQQVPYASVLQGGSLACAQEGGLGRHTTCVQVPPVPLAGCGTRGCSLSSVYSSVGGVAAGPLFWVPCEDPASVCVTPVKPCLARDQHLV